MNTKAEWENLNEKIMKIREKWAEISEYCQDEIMEAVEDYMKAHTSTIIERLEAGKVLHKHDSIPAYHTEEAEDGCQYCLKNAAIDDLIDKLSRIK